MENNLGIVEGGTVMQWHGLRWTAQEAKRWPSGNVTQAWYAAECSKGVHCEQRTSESVPVWSAWNGLGLRSSGPERGAELAIKGHERALREAYALIAKYGPKVQPIGDIVGKF